MTINSCTEALFQILDLLDLTDGDDVIIPSVSFIGVANAIEQTKANIVFCDVNERTLNMEVEHLQEVYTDKTKAVILLHYAGVPCNLDRIIEFCTKHNIIIIEDNANSPFSVYNGKSTGIIGNFGTWSFDSMKIMSMGDGGLIYAKNINDIQSLNKNTYLGLLTNSGYSNDIHTKRCS